MVWSVRVVFGGGPSSPLVVAATEATWPGSVAGPTGFASTGGAVLAARRSSHGFIQSMARNISGLSTIDRMAPARIRSRPCSGSSFSPTPSSARMKENSPIWARLAEIISAVANGIAEGKDDDEGRQRLADDDDGTASPGSASHC